MDTKPQMKSTTRDQKWAWVLTGSGHFFDESLAILRTLGNCDVFVSKAAEEVLRMYKHRGEIFPPDSVVYRDTTASAAPVGQFYKGLYHTLVMAPVSSNTIAKMVFGISDTLVSRVMATLGGRKHHG